MISEHGGLSGKEGEQAIGTIANERMTLPMSLARERESDKHCEKRSRIVMPSHQARGTSTRPG